MAAIFNTLLPPTSHERLMVMARYHFLQMNCYCDFIFDLVKLLTANLVIFCWYTGSEMEKKYVHIIKLVLDFL